MILNLQKMIAYKDLEKSQCYLERMKDSESGVKHNIKIQSRSQSSKMRDEPRTMYVPDNNLSKYEVSMRRMQFQWRGEFRYLRQGESFFRS
jgi:hypothetical protein